MSFLTKNWRFTVPALVVLCVLLVGIVTLCSTGERSESKRVYVMPERSTDNPPSINTGEAPIASVAGEEDSVSTASADNEDSSDTEPLESCCPEEDLLDDQASTHNASPGSHVHDPSPEAIEDARKHKEFILAYLAHGERAQALVDEWQILDKQEEQVATIVHKGVIINVFDEISVDESGHLNTGRLTKSEAEHFVKQAQLKYDEIARNKEAVWQRLQELTAHEPLESTYTSTAYKTDH